MSVEEICQIIESVGATLGALALVGVLCWFILSLRKPSVVEVERNSFLNAISAALRSIDSKLNK